MTMIVVTHEIAFAREVGDRAIFMADGVVVEDGPARDVLTAPARAAHAAVSRPRPQPALNRGDRGTPPEHCNTTISGPGQRATSRQ
jgi:ABC-type glutathione transport system ATPase component